MFSFLIAAIIGSMVGFLGGFQGIAGGFYIIMLLLATNLVKTQSTAAGTTLFAILFPISIGAVWEYYKSGDVNIPIALTITVFYTIFATLGSKANKQFDEHIPLFSLAVTMCLSSIYFGYKGIEAYKKIKH
jgi:hypothetical protein